MWSFSQLYVSLFKADRGTEEASSASPSTPGLCLLLKGFQQTTVLLSSCFLFHHHKTPAVRSSSHLASDESHLSQFLVERMPLSGLMGAVRDSTQDFPPTFFWRELSPKRNLKKTARELLTISFLQSHDCSGNIHHQTAEEKGEINRKATEIQLRNYCQ